MTENTPRAATQEELKTIKYFNKMYYDSRLWATRTFCEIPINKCPNDLFVYQEIFYETQPDVVIETGTFRGGTSYFFNLLILERGHGEIITCDIKDQRHWKVCDADNTILFHEMSSTSEAFINLVHSTPGKKMFILDSGHSYKHVAEELRLFHDLILPGQYLIVEDTNVDQMNDGGPIRAVREFLREHDEFERDIRRELDLQTLNPSGYLRRRP